MSQDRVDEPCDLGRVDLPPAAVLRGPERPQVNICQPSDASATTAAKIDTTSAATAIDRCYDEPTSPRRTLRLVPEYRIRYEGSPARVGALAQELRDEGVVVSYTPPTEQRGGGEIVEAVVVSIVANGAYDAIKAGIRRFREWQPRSSVEIEGDDEQPRET
jgi:hypothetical protein